MYKYSAMIITVERVILGDLPLYPCRPTAILCEPAVDLLWMNPQLVLELPNPTFLTNLLV
jgi:hypothetical protein